MSNLPTLVPLSEIEPAAYNPREADTQRLEALRLSLSKLGFILPLYATDGGHLLSGHQRSTVAEMLGCESVPVVRVNAKNERVRNINLLFNRATNDMGKRDTSANLWDTGALNRILELAETMPDRDPLSAEFNRCMTPVDVPISDLLKGLTVEYDSGAMSMCAKLLMFHVVMPVVATPSGRIINGQYRLMAAAEAARKGTDATYPVVYISEDEAELSEALLNMISMKFTVENQYADQLRFGAFRRASNIVEDLLPCYRMLADNFVHKSAEQSMKDEPKFWNKFRQAYGESIADLGAGQRRTRPKMEARGIRCIDWEPYPLDWRHELDEEVNRAKPSLVLARKVTDEFLADVATGVRYSTVGLPAVLNSVPFRFDRRCLLAMAHSLVGIGDQLVGDCRSNLELEVDRPWLRVRESGKLGTAMALFRLDYEPGVVLGDVAAMPKIQKLHSPSEIRADLSLFFEDVLLKTTAIKHYYRCRAPKRINPAVLKTALLHEFNLPYEGGESIRRGQEALEAFGQRLKIDFSKIKEAPRP